MSVNHTERLKILTRLAPETAEQYRAEHAEELACEVHASLFGMYPAQDAIGRYLAGGLWYFEDQDTEDSYIAWMNDQRANFEPGQNFSHVDPRASQIEYFRLTGTWLPEFAAAEALENTPEKQAEAESEAAESALNSALEVITEDASFYDPELDSVDPPSMLTGEGIALMYPGKAHLVYAPRDTGKTTLATLAAAQEIKAGNKVLWFDYENQHGQIVERLISLGIDADTVNTSLLHINRPDGADITTYMEASATVNEIKAEGDGRIALVIADAARGLAGAVAPDVRDSLGHDVAAVEQAFINPARSAGVAVLILTHEAGGTAFGSQHWESCSDVVIRMKPGQAFKREKNGYASVHVVRDRVGYGEAGLVGHMAVIDGVPELVQPNTPVQPREATGKGTGRCAGEGCGKGIDKRATLCKTCSNRETLKSRGQIA